MRIRFVAGLALLCSAGWIAPVPGAAAAVAGTARPTIATIPIPGDPAFVAVARDVIDVQGDVSADVLAEDGLFDDAIRVPSFAQDRVAALHRRLLDDEKTLKTLPWRAWDVDRQIEARWVFANAESLDRTLTVEQLYAHRPDAWLEPLANTYIAIVTYAPERRDAFDGLTARVPAMVAEMTRLCVPNQRDVTTADGTIAGILGMLKANAGPGNAAAIASLTSYRDAIDAMKGLKPYTVVGASDYAWRLRRGSMLDDTPNSLIARAQRELTGVDAALASIGDVPDPAPEAAEIARAQSLTQSSLLDLYDAIQVENLKAIQSGGFVTVPAGVGPIHARVTPDAMIPLTGDGGSMNPPPAFGTSNVGYWNVEHLNPNASLADRENTIRYAVDYRSNGMGPYAAHEGVPGHHLQPSIARLNLDPIRNIWTDPAQVEGWALYAEQEFYERGGLGPAPSARASTLRSWRFRIRRVVYDVDVETGLWNLPQAADWKDGADDGKGKIDEDLLRTINWPAQLIGYFAGKEQILDLKAAYRAKTGAAYSERAFNDAVLAMGSVPYVFARAKMLGEAVPGMEDETP